MDPFLRNYNRLKIIGIVMYINEKSEKFFFCKPTKQTIQICKSNNKQAVKL